MILNSSNARALDGRRGVPPAPVVPTGDDELIHAWRDGALVLACLGVVFAELIEIHLIGFRFAHEDASPRWVAFFREATNRVR